MSGKLIIMTATMDTASATIEVMKGDEKVELSRKISTAQCSRARILSEQVEYIQTTPPKPVSNSFHLLSCRIL